jgi:TPR repeat protein
LGRAYADGDCLRKSNRHAKAWLSKAAGNGHAKARQRLRALE